MRLLLLAAILRSIVADDQMQNSYKICKSICREYDQNKLKSNGCQPALHVSPKPRVHQACLKGEAIGFDHACLPSCTGAPHEGRDYIPGNSFEACKKFKGKPTPNYQLMWCRQGYDRTYNRVKEDIRLIINTEVIDEEKESPEKVRALMEGESSDANIPDVDNSLLNEDHEIHSKVKKINKLVEKQQNEAKDVMEDKARDSLDNKFEANDEKSVHEEKDLVLESVEEVEVHVPIIDRGSSEILSSQTTMAPIVDKKLPESKENGIISKVAQANESDLAMRFKAQVSSQRDLNEIQETDSESRQNKSLFRGGQMRDDTKDMKDMLNVHVQPPNISEHNDALKRGKEEHDVVESGNLKDYPNISSEDSHSDSNTKSSLEQNEGLTRESKEDDLNPELEL